MNKNLTGFRHRLAKSDALLEYSILGVAAGLVAGLMMVIFRFAIEWPLTHMLPEGRVENFESLPAEWRFGLPIVGVLLMGVVRYFAGEKNSVVGVAHVIDCVNNRHGQMPFKNAITQFFAGAISIISGHSAGREGPGIHIAAATNSLIGRHFNLPNNSLRIMVGCGTAAAIGAAFNTPLAGVIFAMEVIMMEYTIASFTPIILAAAAGSIVSRIVYGAEPAFSVPTVVMHSLWELPYILFLGLVAGSCAAFFLYIQKKCLLLNESPFWARLAVAGLLTGGVAVAVPQIMGTGYDTLDFALAGELTVGLLILIGLSKLFVTAVCSGLGIPFGIIGPSLVIGGCIGGAMGLIGLHVVPELASSESFYVLLGMGAMMGAVLNAPLSALTALLELTYSPSILMPAMVTIITANLVSSQIFGQKPSYDTALKTLGRLVTNNPLHQALKRVGVSSMVTKSHKIVPPLPDKTELENLNLVEPFWLIVRDGETMTLLRWKDIKNWLEEEGNTQAQINLLDAPVKQRKLASLHPRATLHEAWTTIHEAQVDAVYITGLIGRSEISGVISSQDIENYYRDTALD